MNLKSIVSVTDLNNSLEDPNLATFDLQFDLSDKEKGHQGYLKGHIPGAVYADLEKDLSLPASAMAGRHPLPTVAEMEETFSRWGIDEDVHVVVYDDNGGGYAARLWWMLRYLGHNRVALLDGGLPAWVKAGLPLRNVKESRYPRSFRAEPQDWMVVGIPEVLKSIEDEDTLLIDSRSSDRYQGIEEPIDRLAGHIPGAVNRFWQHNLNNEGLFLPKQTLRKEWKELLAGKSSEDSIVHCGSGVTGCQNIFVMIYAGFEGARLYPGSWSQWLEDPDLPKVLGTQAER